MRSNSSWAKHIVHWALIALILHSTYAVCDELSTLLSQAVHGGEYESPTVSDERTAEELFENIFRGELKDEDVRGWKKLGFELISLSQNERHWTILMELQTDKRGRGIYLFPRKMVTPIGLLVPHGYQDLYTREIGFRLAQEGNFAVTAWNTIPRSYRNDKRAILADLTKANRSYFNALSKAFSTVFPDGHLLQIHGFAREKRKTAAGLRSEIILSSGTRSPPNTLVAFADQLRQSTQRIVYVYPLEVRELGGTKNVQGRLLRQVGFDGFIHIEMSKEIRISMCDDLPMRMNFISSIDRVLLGASYE